MQVPKKIVCTPASLNASSQVYLLTLTVLFGKSAECSSCARFVSNPPLLPRHQHPPASNIKRSHTLCYFESVFQVLSRVLQQRPLKGVLTKAHAIPLNLLPVLIQPPFSSTFSNVLMLRIAYTHTNGPLLLPPSPPRHNL